MALDIPMAPSNAGKAGTSIPAALEFITFRDPHRIVGIYRDLGLCPTETPGGWMCTSGRAGVSKVG